MYTVDDNRMYIEQNDPDPVSLVFYSSERLLYSLKCVWPYVLHQRICLIRALNVRHRTRPKILMTFQRKQLTYCLYFNHEDFLQKLLCSPEIMI